MAAPGVGEALAVALKLGETLAVDLHEDELVHLFVNALGEIFPGRLLAVRLFLPGTGELTTVYATGRLRPEGRDAVEITRETLERYDVDLASQGPVNARCLDSYLPLFKDGVCGFDLPVRAGGRLNGILSVEYPAGVRPPSGDQASLAPLVGLLENALRNARTYRQSAAASGPQSRFLDNATLPVLLIGDQGQIQFANRAFLNLSGFSADDLLGQDWLGLLPESERQLVLPTYINALRGEPTSNFEVKLPCRGGSSIHMAALISSVMSADGDIEGVVYVFRDLAAENPAALRHLVSGVVHELNNPLTNISVYGDYLLKKGQQGGSDPGDLEKLRRIVDSSVRIRNFTRDLVAYARPSTEKPSLTSIEDVVNQALMFCEHLVDQTGVAVRKNYFPSLSRAYCVKSQMIQVFVNLITNACHAMPKDAGLLLLETAAHGEGKVAVRVCDTGSGIPEHNVDRIFEPFFTTKGEGMGTGLGLSIIKNIIEQHRGSISVRSEVGSGTTFEVILSCRSEIKSE